MADRHSPRSDQSNPGDATAPGNGSPGDHRIPENRERTWSRNGSPAAAGDTRIRRGAKALVSAEDRVLLVRERHADGAPFWTLPGGGVCPAETPERALERELAEELRCRCRVGEPRTAFWYAHRSLRRTVSLYTVFDCRLLTRPLPADAEGVEAVRWVDPADPPVGTLSGVRVALRDCRD